MTSKRSCILVLAVGIMGYFLVKAKVQGRNVKAIVNRMAKYILTILVIFLAMYFVTKLMKLDIVRHTLISSKQKEYMQVSKEEGKREAVIWTKNYSTRNRRP